jgi:hypothetical protein
MSPARSPGSLENEAYAVLDQALDADEPAAIVDVGDPGVAGRVRGVDGREHAVVEHDDPDAGA